MKEKARKKTEVEKRPKYKKGERMKKNVIVITGHELTPEERKNYSKDHPGSRLCFRLRLELLISLSLYKKKYNVEKKYTQMIQMTIWEKKLDFT